MLVFGFFSLERILFKFLVWHMGLTLFIPLYRAPYPLPE